MGTNNHLLATIVDSGGFTTDIDIQFEFGDVREHVYRIGDELRFSTESLKGQKYTAVVPGIAVDWHRNEKTRLGTASRPGDYRYFRIIVVDGRIISFAPTTVEDFEMLDTERR